MHLEPRRPYAEMPAYVRDFDVGMIPFRVDPMTRAVDPVKIYEYFSLGKPVVARPLPELSRFGDLVPPRLSRRTSCPRSRRRSPRRTPPCPSGASAPRPPADWDGRVDTLLAAAERGRTRGYDRVRSRALGQRLTRGPVASWRADDVADVVRLRPELLSPPRPAGWVRPSSRSR